MALTLDAMAGHDKSIEELIEELPRYWIHKTKVPLAGTNTTACFERLEQRFAEAQKDRSDGLRLDWPDRWLLIRASNTEPIVRLVAEAKTAEIAAQLCDQAAEVMG